MASQQQYDVSPPLAAPPKHGWRSGLPVLANAAITLREVRAADAAALLRELSSPTVTKFIQTPPNTAEGFRRFARWAQRERRRGMHLTFAVRPAGCEEPCGIIQIWPIERDFSTAEWGVVVGDQHWGRGIVIQAAHLLFEFAFATLGVCRLEGRVVDGHERAAAVLRKLWATAEGRLRG